MLSVPIYTEPHYPVEISAKYKCTKCGHAFYRKNKDWFTVNPLKTNDFNNRKKKLIKELSAKVRKCPKCKEDVKPL